MVGILGSEADAGALRATYSELSVTEEADSNETPSSCSRNGPLNRAACLPQLQHVREPCFHWPRKICIPPLIHRLSRRTGFHGQRRLFGAANLPDTSRCSSCSADAAAL